MKIASTPIRRRHWQGGLITFLSVALLALLGGPVSGRAEDLPATRPAPATPAPVQVIAGESFDRLHGTPGFWRLGRTVNGVWWFISPDDRLEWLNTVTTVQPFQMGRRAQGPHYVSNDWNGTLDTSTGDLNAWAEATLQRVRDAGFKGLGAWCHPIFHNFDVPITRDLNVWAHMVGPDRLLYSPAWRSIAEDVIRRQVEPLRENRNLVGYYTDNELDWGDAGAGPATYFDQLAPDDPNRQQVIAVIRSLWPDVAAFNSAWKTSFVDYAELESLERLPHEPAEAYGRLYSAWLERLATDYFRITSELVRKYDPNHLVLGVRFRGHAPVEVVRGGRGVTDAQSINYYVPDAKLDPDMFPEMYEAGDQPIILTEYAFHALDGRSGNRNTFGFAAQVLDQEARAEGYKAFTQRLARVPYIIGADWFQWSDEPPSGRTSDGEDVNFGIVDIDDRPYEKLVAAIRETTPTLNDLHAGSTSDMRADVFRESFAERPSFTVPRKSWRVRINGELSDWPASAKLPSVRHSQTLGLERSPLPKPNVYVSWDEAGLYFGVEVFDRDIAGAPADGWWWTRDGVELFISTRPAMADQRFYTPADHQFFFVPIDFPGPDGNSGTIGQWKRPGDAIAQSLIPHPQIEEASRVYPDRYIFEAFIPAAALHGFDPTGQTALGFNFHAKNFQSATEYFWSAPKSIQTQLRPATWGELKLSPTDLAALSDAGNAGGH